MPDFVQLHSKYRSDMSGTLNFPPHLHSHIEMVYVFEGRCDIRVDGSDYTATAGDALIVFPNCVHSYHNCCDGKYFCAIFPVEAVPSHREAFLTTRPKNPFIPKKEISAEAKALLGILSRSGEKRSDLFSGVMTALLCELLPKTEIAEHSVSNTTKQLLDFCLAHYHEPITLAELSEKLHISKSRISHIFEEKVGLPFRYYVNYLRVMEACRRLLSSNDGAGEIAFLCGFDSIRSFNRNFLYIIGTTPSEYRKEAKTEADKLF